MGNQKPGKHPSPPLQSQMGASLVKIPRLSGVGRVVEDGTDEDQARAEKMDHWIAWEAEERVEARGEGGGTGRGLRPNLTSFPFLFCSGGLMLRAKDPFCCGDGRGPKPVSFFLCVIGGHVWRVYIHIPWG